MTAVAVRGAARTVRRTAVLVPALGAVVVLVSVVWGWDVQSDPNTKLGAAPLVGEWRARAGPALAVATTCGALVAWFGPTLAARWSFARTVTLGALTSVVFTFALAASDGMARLLDPVVHPTEYWANLATLPPPQDMLRRYGTVEFLLDYSVHAKGHPPGFLLVLQGLDAIGLGRPWVAGTLSYVGVAVVVVAVGTTVRLVAGDVVARAALPFLVVAPYAVWAGTSADAFYSGVAAVGVLLVAVAARAASVARRRTAAAIGGLVLGAGLFLTYGVAIFLGLPAVLVGALCWRRWRALADVAVAAAAGAAAVTVAFAAAGFWWFDGATTTKTFYWWGTAQFRPAGYFAIANLGATAIALGPAVVVALGRRRPAAHWWLVGGALFCILAADASQYSKAEVERIWLLFFPWVAPAAAVLSPARRWLALQVATAVGLQLFLRSKW